MMGSGLYVQEPERILYSDTNTNTSFTQCTFLIYINIMIMSVIII